MKTAITLLVLALIAFGAMQLIFWHSYPDPHPLSDNLERIIRKTDFFVGLAVTPVAVVFAIIGWVRARESMSRLRSGLGITSIVLMACGWLSLITTFVVWGFHAGEYGLFIEPIFAIAPYLAFPLGFFLRGSSRPSLFAAIFFQMALVGSMTYF
jgi:hypothetical protein